MKLISCRTNDKLANKIADYLDVKLVDLALDKFSDGEVSCEILENIRGEDCFVVQSFISSDSIMALLITIDALKRASAGIITAVIPYFGYARQDRKSRSRTPITAKLMADLLQVAGVNRVITMDLHAGQIQGFFDIPVDDLYARKTLCEDIRKQNIKDLCIVSPDAGGVARARALAKSLDASLAIIDKRREVANQSEVMHVIGNVVDKSCVIVDDIADTCGTLMNAADALKENGASSVRAYITHGVLSGPAKDRLSTSSSLEELVITDTIYHAHPTKSLRIVSVGGVFGEAIRRIYNNESVSNLFIDDIK